MREQITLSRRILPHKPSLSIFVLRGLFNSELSPNDSIKGHDNHMHPSDPDHSLLRALVSQGQTGPTRKSSILLIDIPQALTTFLQV